MTGFGLATAATSARTITVEMRSTNAKSLEIRTRVPDELAGHALAFEEALRVRFGRGRFDVAVRETSGDAAGGTTLDVDRALELYRAFRALQDRLGQASEPLPVSIVAGFPGVFAGRREPEAEILQAIADAVGDAADALDAARAAEGASMRDEFLRRAATIRERLATIETRAPEVRTGKEARTRDRLARSSLGNVPEERVAAELALALERNDFAEEASRLAVHLSLFVALCEDATTEAGRAAPQVEPLGKRLDFLLQEILREATTLSAKAQDTGVSHAIVDIKVEIERLREQMQNVE